MAHLAQLPFEAFEEVPTGWQTSLPADEWTQSLRTELNELMDLVSFDIEVNLLPAKNWNAIWEAGFKEIVLGDFCQIRAPFHDRRLDVTHSIVIDPRMAFGTGHHETTRLVIRAMRQVNASGAHVLDFGAGTGILSILAQKMGASRIFAVECDPVAFDNLKENIAVNESNVIRCQLTENLLSFTSEAFDLVLANITRNVLVKHMPQIFRILKLDGIAIFSGFLQVDETIMCKSMIDAGGRVETSFSENGWLSIIAKKQST